MKPYRSRSIKKAKGGAAARPWVWHDGVRLRRAGSAKADETAPSPLPSISFRFRFPSVKRLARRRGRSCAARTIDQRLEFAVGVLQAYRPWYSAIGGGEIHRFLSAKENYGQAYFRYRRRRVVFGQGHHGSLFGAFAEGARLQGDHAEDGSVPQRGPGHHEPIPAWRGLRYRRRS